MFLFSKPTTMVTPEDALPGRDDTMPVPDKHDVLGTLDELFARMAHLQQISW